MLLEESEGLGSYRTHPRVGHMGRKKNVSMPDSLGHSSTTCCCVAKLCILEGVHAAGRRPPQREENKEVGEKRLHGVRIREHVRRTHEPWLFDVF